jgi:hypothetical protein
MVRYRFTSYIYPAMSPASSPSGSPHWSSWIVSADCSRKLNESSSKVEDPAVLKLPLCTPKVKKITLHFPLGLEVTARNMKGVTIKDALDAIHKQFKKRVCTPFRRVGRSCFWFSLMT